MISKDQLQKAGWLSITNAIFTVPAIAMSFFLDSLQGVGAKFGQAVLMIVSLGLFVYVLSSLKRLLNERFRFHETDLAISYLLWGNLSLTLFQLLTLVNPEFESTVAILSVLAYIFFGILSLIFATRLQRLPDPLYGLLKPYCRFTIVSGTCFITVVLLPLGVLAGAVTDILLGLIFFRAAEQSPSHSEVFSTPIE